MHCPACDTPNPPEAVRCEECGAKLPARPRRPAPALEEEDEPRPVRSRRRPPEDLDDEDEADEEYERRPRRRRPRYEDEEEEEDEVVATIIPYKNPRALASYYISFFTLIPIIGILLGIASIVLGILGIRYAGRHRKAKGTAHAVIGIALSVLFIAGNVAFCLLYYYWIYRPR
jgi:hypothetical protein